MAHKRRTSAYLLQYETLLVRLKIWCEIVEREL